MSHIKESPYTPRQTGITSRFSHDITYIEQKPDKKLQDVVYCVWTLKTQKRLSDDFTYTVMPDACIDIVFNINGASPPLAMTPHLHIKELHLGTQFHYVGIRFKPGVFTDASLDIRTLAGRQQDLPSISKVDLGVVGKQLREARTSTQLQHSLLIQLANDLRLSGAIMPNALIKNVIQGMQFGIPLADIAQKAGYSPRQLRRKISLQTGFSPVQLRRVIRFQLALSSQDVALRFADQSHLIKEFKSITGASYKSFTRTFKQLS